MIIAIISLYQSYRKNVRTIGDSIKNELINLPPYESGGDSSTIIVKNVGNTKAILRNTCVLFDWDEHLRVDIDHEIDEDNPVILPLNGEISFHKTLPIPPTEGEHFITVCTCTRKSNERFSNEFRTFF